jgi:hypothetical protein
MDYLEDSFIEYEGKKIAVTPCLTVDSWVPENVNLEKTPICYRGKWMSRKEYEYYPSTGQLVAE